MLDTAAPIGKVAKSFKLSTLAEYTLETADEELLLELGALLAKLELATLDEELLLTAAVELELELVVIGGVLEPPPPPPPPQAESSRLSDKVEYNFI